MTKQIIYPSESAAILATVNYGPHLDTLRTLFVSSLENRIYEALETFVYNDTELLSKFPNLRRCLNIFNLLKTIYQSTREPETGMLHRLFTYTFKHLIKDGLMRCFLNAILLNNRLNRICDDLDSMSVDKNFLKFFKLRRTDNKSLPTMTETPAESIDPIKKRAIKRKASCGPDGSTSIINDESFVPSTCSPILAKAKNSDHKKIVKNVLSCGPSTCSFYRLRAADLSVDFYEKNLNLKIDKRTNGDGIDEKQLTLPCQSEEIIQDLMISDPSVMISCFGDVKRKFKAQIRRICTVVNRIMGRIDKKRVKKCVLYCKILGNCILFKLKLKGRDGSRCCLFSNRIVTKKTSRLSTGIQAMEIPEAGENEENREIGDSPPSFLSNYENSTETFYSGEDSGDCLELRKQGISGNRRGITDDNDNGDVQSSNSRQDVASQFSSFYSCESFGISEASTTEWHSAYCGFIEDPNDNLQYFIQSSEHEFPDSPGNPQSEKVAEILKGKLENFVKCDFIGQNRPNKITLHSDQKAQIRETLRSILRRETASALNLTSQNSEFSLERLLKINQVNFEVFEDDTGRQSHQTIDESCQNYSSLELKVVRMLESIFEEAEAQVLDKKKLENSAEKSQEPLLCLTNAELEQLIEKKLLKILLLLLDISDNFLPSKLSKNPISTENWSQTPQEIRLKQCPCGVDMKTRTIFTQTSPRHSPNGVSLKKSGEKGFPTREKFSKPFECSKKSALKSLLNVSLSHDDSKILKRKLPKKSLDVKKNPQRPRNVEQASLICILQESEERTRKCRTSTSEIFLPTLSYSRSGTFIISRSESEKFSEIEDLFDDMNLMETLSSPLSVFGSSRSRGSSSKKQKKTFSDVKLLFLFGINRNLKIFLSSIYRRLKIIFSEGAPLARLRYRIKKKLYKLILEKNKSTNTPKHFRMPIFSSVPDHSAYFQRKNPEDNANKNCKIRDNCREENCPSLKNTAFEENARYKDFRQNLFLKGKKKGREQRIDSTGYCCGGRINSPAHFVEIYQNCGGKGKTKDSSRKYFWTWHLNSNRSIDDEFKGMLVEHVNLCRDVRNSLIRRI